MICQKCQTNTATVHIDEVQAFHGPGHEKNVVEVHHFCESCAQEAQLPHAGFPHAGAPQNAMDEVWKLLQISAMQAQKKSAPPAIACGECGTNLEQLRRKGRVGCQGCYETFRQYLEGLLERMHGSAEHVGRLPGLDAQSARRQRAIDAAQSALEAAVQTEDFERAAELRDELQRLSTDRAGSGGLSSTSLGPDALGSGDGTSAA